MLRIGSRTLMTGTRPAGSSRPVSGNRRGLSSPSPANTAAATRQPPASARRSPGREPAQPYPPGCSRVLRRPLAGAALESGSVAGGRRGARGSGGAPDHRALVVVDQVAPGSVRAAAQDVAGRAVEVHLLAVGAGAVDCPVQDDQGDVVVG